MASSWRSGGDEAYARERAAHLGRKRAELERRAEEHNEGRWATGRPVDETWSETVDPGTLEVSRVPDVGPEACARECGAQAELAHAGAVLWAEEGSEGGGRGTAGALRDVLRRVLALDLAGFWSQVGWNKGLGTAAEAFFRCRARPWERRAGGASFVVDEVDRLWLAVVLRVAREREGRLVLSRGSWVELGLPWVPWTRVLDVAALYGQSNPGAVAKVVDKVGELGGGRVDRDARDSGAKVVHVLEACATAEGAAGERALMLARDTLATVAALADACPKGVGMMFPPGEIGGDDALERAVRACAALHDKGGGVVDRVAAYCCVVAVGAGCLRVDGPVGVLSAEGRGERLARCCRAVGGGGLRGAIEAQGWLAAEVKAAEAAGVVRIAQEEDREALQFCLGTSNGEEEEEEVAEEELAGEEVGALSLEEVGGDAERAVLASCVHQVRDLFPDLGEGFVAACLKAMDVNPERVVQALLEDALPGSVAGLDRSLPAEPPRPRPEVTRRQGGVPSSHGGAQASQNGLSAGVRKKGTLRSAVRVGCTVDIVLKRDQPSGRLTRGVVGEVLTGAHVHPRGIKVRLKGGGGREERVGRVQRIVNEAAGPGDLTRFGGVEYGSAVSKKGAIGWERKARAEEEARREAAAVTKRMAMAMEMYEDEFDDSYEDRDAGPGHAGEVAGDSEGEGENKAAVPVIKGGKPPPRALNVALARARKEKRGNHAGRTTRARGLPALS